MTIAEQTWTASSPPAASESIPVASRRFGSWEFTLRRRARTTGDLAGLYDDASEGWARTSRRFRLETAYRDPLFASGVTEALAGRDARVLDCGIGSGSLSLALAGITTGSPEYHGIDTSGAMLAAADGELRGAGIAARPQQSDIRTIPYPDRTFDVAMAAHVLEHLPDPQVALHEMVRVLKPGGIMFACMTRRSVFGTFVQLRWRTWMVSERQGIAWLRESGMDGIGFQPIGLGFGAGRASTAFWARKPVGTVCLSRNEGITPRGGPAR